jgi:hypothetical protein
MVFETERAVLGAVLRDDSVFSDVCIHVQNHRYFADTRNQNIFTAMLKLGELSKPIDLISTADKLKELNKLDGIGYSYLAQLTDSAPVSANAGFYAEQLSQEYRISLSHKRLKEISSSNNLEEISKGVSEIAELVENSPARDITFFSKLIEERDAARLNVQSVVPPTVFKFMKSVATLAYSNFPIEATFTHLLSITAGLAGNTFSLVRDRRPVKTILSSVVSMDSSWGKSDNLSILIKPLADIQQEYHLKFKEEEKEYKKHLEKTRHLRKTNPALENDREEPKEKTILTTKSTVEQLIVLLSENPNGILYAKDEISGAFSGMNEYKKGQGSDKDVLLELLAGESVISHTVSRGSNQAYNSRLSLTGGIQPAKMEEWLRTLSIDDGFWGRFLFFTERNNYTELTPRTERIPIDIDIIGNFYRSIMEIIELGKPVYFEFENEDQIDCISEYLNTRKNQSPKEIKNYIGKCFNFFQRIAVVLHLINCHFSGKSLNNKIISQDTIADAFLITVFYLAQAESLFCRKSETIEEQIIREILNFPAAARTVDKIATSKLRELIDKNIRGGKVPDKIRKLFERMEQGSLGTIIKLSKSEWQFVLKGETI